MTDKNKDLIDQKLQELNDDGVDRRGFLKCMAWAGTGLVWTMSGGIPSSRAFAKTAPRSGGNGGDFSFVQISDSHIGFNKPANPDVTATLQTAINKINAMQHRHDFLILTGDSRSALETKRVRYAGPGIKGSVREADLLRAGRAQHAE